MEINLLNINISIYKFKKIIYNCVIENILPKILKPKNTIVIAFADHFKVDAIVKYRKLIYI